ncbi:PREDICTED: putative gustatory receptor 28b [Cyphomyrmex costatus]|uniref:putative gustatory receptor 28b n=1 Tax=Cyphomyrmex costatus TaxID=456900 RepID=UPI000852246E|nr:PREDICTED: putative gustatory receptor 28b [Cyphomyrmex costatus]
MQEFITTNNESHFPRSIYYKQRNLLLVMELKILKKQHLTISDTMILIVWACETSKNQAQQISTSIYDAFNSTTDEQIKDERLVVNDIKSSTTGLICHIQRNQILLLKLKALKEWHLKVNDTVQMLNTIFGLQLLVIIVRSFTNFTFDVYSDVVRWQDGVFISFDIHYLDMLSSSTAHYALKITLLVWACQTGKNQAQEISTTVHDVLNNINDEQIKNELQLYSLQILHHKNIFSAKGFTIDASLLTSIIGKITTYLIIMIQFLNMSHSCDRSAVVNVTQSTYKDA